ncbi:MAG TPA: cyclic nucleotide-binding domain-containing protein [Lacipirellulaceae bacterium]|nr:cyclic nucleotide-binding domain-containing protein [Lacipirellulaceae bacterium]
MVDTEVAVARPQRWDEPFGREMRDADVERLLEVEPFRSIDPRRFPPTLPLRGILQNDVRIQRYAAGDIVVREGDYGSSAFLILRGRARVVLSGLAPESLGRPAARRLGWLATFAKVLMRSRGVEVRRDAAPTRSPAAADGAGSPQHGRIFVQDVPRVLDHANTVVLEAGEIFGELAALTRSPRTATVFAEGDATLLEIRWQGLRDLMRRTDALRQHIERLYRANSLRVHLRETPLFAELPPDRLAALAEATLFESHGEFDWHASESAVKRRPGDAIIDEPLIAEEGAPCDGLILVRSGFARKSRRRGHGHRTSAYLGRGQAFGMAESIESAAAARPVPWRHSWRALGYVDVLRIPQRTLETLVYPLVGPDALVALAREEGASFADVDSTGADAIGTGPGVPAAPAPLVDQGLLEFLVDRRLINGREAMVIDLDRCTRCDDCVRACAATHDNNPRFVRQGPRHGSFMAAQACMHCADPVCMIGCPTGAIGRDPATGVVRINDRTCIGCSTCAESCPYGNIQMEEIRDRRGALLVDAATRQPLAKATKCDLCSDLAGGPACQRACPHDALIRINLGNLEEVAHWVSR